MHWHEVHLESRQVLRPNHDPQLVITLTHMPSGQAVRARGPLKKEQYLIRALWQRLARLVGEPPEEE